MAKAKASKTKTPRVPEASYRQRKRAVEKGMDDAIEAGLSQAFNQALRACGDVNPNARSGHFIRAFYRRLRERVEERAMAVRS